jgi:hypothetical protein
MEHTDIIQHVLRCSKYEAGGAERALDCYEEGSLPFYTDVFTAFLTLQYDIHF